VVGINLPFTGADAHDAELIKDRAMLAIDEANAQGGAAGYKIEVLLLDDGTAIAGQYDPTQAGVKLVKQAYEVLLKMIKGGGDGIMVPRYCAGGLPSRRGWYATIAAPNILESPDAAPVIERFAKKYGQQPENYSIAAYDAALVILDAIRRVAASGKEVTREAVRDAM
jgi:ABC-type branched-subunit amino acid transport system substrate-binding protein